MRVTLLASVYGFKTSPDVAAEVKKESNQDIKIHEVFQNLETEDVNKEKKMKGDKNLMALIQTGMKETPVDHVQAEVNREMEQNIQIHDDFAEIEKKDKEEVTRIKKDPNLAQIQLNSRTSPGRLARIVASQGNQNLQIHEPFVETEQKDVAEVQKIKKDKNLSQLLQIKTSPTDRIAKQVHEQAQENVQIHENFQSMEKEDKKNEKDIHRNKNLTQFIQKQRGDDFGGNDDDAMDKYLGVDFSGSLVPEPLHQESTHQGTVTVPLSSQLQESASFLQLKTKVKNAPGVEKEVAAESMEDVYLSDEWKIQEKQDAREISKVKHDPNMKA